jgi:hypothetical protein
MSERTVILLVGFGAGSAYGAVVAMIYLLVRGSL